MAEKILIVEDNPQNMMLISDLLELKGYNVTGCFSAKEALEILENTTPHIILMDIQLPQMDGLELTQLIRKQSRFQNTPIIAVTALAMQEDRDKIMEAGCNGYISKPINTRTFVEQVQKYISKNL